MNPTAGRHSDDFPTARMMPPFRPTPFVRPVVDPPTLPGITVPPIVNEEELRLLAAAFQAAAVQLGQQLAALSIAMRDAAAILGRFAETVRQAQDQ